MTWLGILIAQGPGTGLTPVDAASESVLGYLFSYGPVGIGFTGLAWLLLKGWRLISPPAEAAAREKDRADARRDLETELARVLAEAAAREERLIAEKRQVEEQRDDALRIAQNQLVPLLTSFTATTTALIPLLQEVVRTREGSGGHDAGRSR